jgi:two-component system alkaline phosphatase synthesis response regulator PhoP
MTDKILIVEDDLAIAQGLQEALAADGYTVECVMDGRTGLERARSGSPALVILDIMLPRMSGLEVAKRLRDEGRSLPIILLTARAEEDDRVLGLFLGADDYVTKPFSVRELLARVRSVLRRTQTSGGKSPLQVFRFGNVTVDLKRQSATKGGSSIDLSAREFRLLRFLIEHAGEMLSRERLLNEVWGYDVFPTTRTVDNHIARLRKKIEDDPERPQYILTQRGAGYVFEADGTEPEGGSERP